MELMMKFNGILKTFWLYGIFACVFLLSTGGELCGMMTNQRQLARLKRIADALQGTSGKVRPLQNVTDAEDHHLYEAIVISIEDGDVVDFANIVKGKQGAKLEQISSPNPTEEEIKRLIEANKTELDKYEKIVADERAAKAEDRKLIVAAEAKAIENGGKVRAFMQSMQEPKTWLTFGAIGVALATAYFGGKYLYKKFTLNMGKPKLIRESFGLGFWDSLDDQPDDVSLDDIVLAPDIEAKAHEFAESIRQASEVGLPFENALIYGPAGTGKTDFMRLVAKYSGMAYVILSGADFIKLGVAAVHELFGLADRCKRGLIIFIDEADACCANRALLDQKRIDVVNAFLSHTGSSSEKFALVLSTNYEDVLDLAIRSRMHWKIEFKLPGIEERFKIFTLKIDKYVTNYKRTYEKDGVEVEESVVLDSKLNEQYFRELSAKTEGFSGRDITFAVQTMCRQAIMSGVNMLTPSIIEKVIASKTEEVAKDKRVVEKQRKLYKAKMGIELEA